MVNLKKEETKIEHSTISFQNAPIEEVKFCESCRYYRVSWLAFCCAMLGCVVPFVIVRIGEVAENEANIFLLITAVLSVIVFFYMKPIEIKKADKQFKDMGYRSHYHV